MNQILVQNINEEIKKGIAKWGATDTTPDRLLAAATEELGEVAHAINHSESIGRIRQEITEVMGILARLYDMVIS